MRIGRAERVAKFFARRQRANDFNEDEVQTFHVWLPSTRRYLGVMEHSQPERWLDIRDRDNQLRS